MAAEHDDFWAQHLKEQSGPLGAARIASNRLRAKFSHASQEAGDNLLLKAYDGLRKGDEARAVRFTKRAAALDWDPHERTFPGAWCVQMMLFNAVVDELKACDIGDTSWLDAAVTAMDAADGWGRSQLAHCLRVIENDYEVETVELRRIQEVVAVVPKSERIEDLTDVTEDELAAAILSVLRGVRAYDEACDALG